MKEFHGIDIGGTKIERVTYRDIDGELTEVARDRVATPANDYSAFIQAVVGLVESGDAALGNIAPVGIGLPGVTDSSTGRQVSSNVPALNGRVVSDALSEALLRPVAIGNDCQCFALSEAQGGAAASVPTMFGAIIGTGAGGGYCVNGNVLRGQNGVAGEWGHWPLPAHLLVKYTLPIIECPCGQRGCLERYVSGPGMRRLHIGVGGDDAEPIVIAARANGGDTIAGAALGIHLDLLAHAMAGVIKVVDPHVIVLGGGLSQLPHLYRELPTAIQRHLFAGVRVPPILAPRFGAAGGARGAALFVRQQLQKLST